MCVGHPVKVVSVNGFMALCEGADGLSRVDLALVGGAEVGDHMLTHLGVAMRQIDAEEARAIADALEAVRCAQAGEPFEHLLADLIDREPQLPLHLRPQPQTDLASTAVERSE